MAIILRPEYQVPVKNEIYSAWNAGHKNIVAVMPTGAGKTKLFSLISIEMAINPTGPRYPTAIMVHRKELVQQISLTLAEEGIFHNIIAPRPVILGIISAQRQLLKKQFYDYHANISVISVDTLNSKFERHKPWADTIRFWVVDEAAHLLRSNKWGKAVNCFPNAIGLGVTATPRRLDKRGLGKHADGVFDTMVEGPTTKWLIEQGFLCKYKVALPNSDYGDHLEKPSDGSDYSQKAMKLASEKSHIVGDIVENYVKFVNGKQAIVFSSDIDTGIRQEREFLARGIAAKLLTGETNDKERLQAMTDYRDKKIKVLLNVDLFDEGLDVPGIEAVFMGRPTMSLGKFLQMIGRGLRPVYAPGFDLSTKEGRLAAQAAGPKPYCTVVDHVGNIMSKTGEMKHGLPDMLRQWTLDRMVKRRDRTNLLRLCENVKCANPFDRALTECPWCGWEAISGSRASAGGGKPALEQVDGDLELLDPDTIANMMKGCVLEDPAKVAQRVAAVAGGHAGKQALNNQIERIKTQDDLSHVIALWAGYQRRNGYTDRQIHKRFYLEFGKTITVALSEPRADMLDTMEQLKGTYRP